MRISDWSSDGCSSDLATIAAFSCRPRSSLAESIAFCAVFIACSATSSTCWRARRSELSAIFAKDARISSSRCLSACSCNQRSKLSRASVVEIGRASCRERVCQRVDLGGRRIIKKKNNRNKCIKQTPQITHTNIQQFTQPYMKQHRHTQQMKLY